jgi:hypothetical protein
VGKTIMMNRRLLGLALLIGANCLVATLAEWSSSLPVQGSTIDWLLFSLFYLRDAIFTAQFLLLGFWTALASDKLLTRLLAGLTLTGISLGIYFVFFWIAGGTQPGDPMDQVVKYCGLALISLLVLRGLRPWYGWRLVWEGSPDTPQSRQYRILDLLAWTAAVAIPLGVLQTLYGSEADVWAIVPALTFLSILPITIPSFCWAVRPHRTYRRLIILLLWTAIWPVFLWLLFNAYFYVFTGRGGWDFLMMTLLQIPYWSAYYLPLVLLLIGNVLALRRIGLQPVGRTGLDRHKQLPPTIQ